MKTLEERAEFFINELPDNHNLSLGQVIAGFAREHAKAKLEEAAEKLNPLFKILPNINDTPPAYRKSEENYSQHWRKVKREITETPLD